ncbi:MAG TPA: phosphoribosyltransferase family protein [Thermoanaerobaculia bacterium]|nr:phosphoribosyltransferase family protein [Thermoanaerobaculia bacterium]
MSTKITEEFSAAAIAARVAELGREIRTDAGSDPVFLLGVLKGTSVFLADLLRAVDGDAGYGFIDTVRDIDDTTAADAMEIDFLSFIDIADRNVFLLKDVVSTGVIENYLMTQLRQKKPASIQLVALLDRPDLRTLELQVDHYAFRIDGGTFVGYGLEHEGLYGNLPYIGRV